jgi:hypothetical protein
MNPHLDQLLTLEEAAQWLGLTPRCLLEKSRGHRPFIPAIRDGRKFIRFHPQTILAKFAADACVSPEVIAASFQQPPPSLRSA